MRAALLGVGLAWGTADAAAPARAAASPTRVEICRPAGPGLGAVFRSSEGCAARWRGAGPESSDACFEPYLWRRVLADPRAHPLGSCRSYLARPAWHAFPREDRRAGESGDAGGNFRRHHRLLRPIASSATEHLRHAPAEWVTAAWNRVERTRHALAEAWSPIGEAGIGGALLSSLALGVAPTAEISEPWRLFGWVHLLSAAGLHLHFAFMAATRFYRLLAQRRVDGSAGVRRARAALILGVILFGAALAGGRPGYLRAALHWGLSLVPGESGRWRRLGITLLLDLLLSAVRAGELTSIAFWASSPEARGRWVYFGAVGGAYLGLDAAARFRSKLPGRAAIAMAIGSWAPLGALSACAGQGLAPLTPLLSLVSAPVVAVGLYPPALALALTSFVVGPSRGVHALAVRLGECVDAIARPALAGVSRWPGAWTATEPASFGVAIAFGMSVALLVRRRRSFRAIAACAVAVTLGLRALAAGPSTIRESAGPVVAVESWDVGQGDLTWIETPRGAWLVDLGPPGAILAATWLKRLGQIWPRRLEGVLLTHGDLDHRGGWEGLVRVARPRCGVFGPPGLGLRDAERAPAECRPPGWPIRIAREPGARGCARNGCTEGRVLALAGGGAWIGLGDTDARGERSALDRLLPLLRSRPGPWILKVSHHGSRFSSDGAFLAALAGAASPGIDRRAWVSASARNSYGHPTPEALARLRATGWEIHRTDVEGALRWRADD